MLPVIIAGAVIGGLANYLSNKSQTDAINENIRRSQALMAEGLIDSEEMAQRLNGIDRMFNQRLTSVLNTTAIRSRGFANTGTIGAAAAGGIEGGRVQARSEAIGQAQESNTRVTRDIAMTELGKQNADPIGSFVGGAVQGASVAMKASAMLEDPGIEVPTDTPGSSLQTPDFNGDNIDAGFGSYNESGFYKTGLGQWQSPMVTNKIEDEDIFNFYNPSLWSKYGLSNNAPDFNLSRGK